MIDEKSIQAAIEKELPAIYKLQTTSIVEELIEKFIEDTTKLYDKLDEEKKILLDNTIFTLESYLTVVRSLPPTRKILLEETQIPRETILKSIDISLSLSFALILALLVLSGKVEATPKRILELAETIRDLTQEWEISLIDLDLWKPFRNVGMIETSGSLEPEEREMLESDMDLYLRQIEKEEKNWKTLWRKDKTAWVEEEVK